MDPAYRVMLIFPISILYSIPFFIIERALADELHPIITGSVFGTFAGVVPVGVIMGIVVLRVRIKPAIRWCFGAASVGGCFGYILLGKDTIALAGGIALCIAALILLFCGPRYRTLRYAQCPGCKYNLALLPKSDVCPECGRNNADLVEAFRDVDL